MKNSTSIRRVLARRTRALRSRLSHLLLRAPAPERRPARASGASLEILEFRALQAGWQRYLPSFIGAIAEVEQLKSELADLKNRQLTLELELERFRQENNSSQNSDG